MILLKTTCPKEFTEKHKHENTNYRRDEGKELLKANVILNSQKENSTTSKNNIKTINQL